MKKFLTLLFVFVALSPMLRGAYQFNEKVLGSALGVDIRETYLTFDGPTTISLSFDKRVKEFGFYDIDTGKMVKGKFDSRFGRTGLLGTFTAEDRIGIWVKKSYGGYYSSTDTQLQGVNSHFRGTEYEIEQDDDDDEIEIEFVIGTGVKRDDGEWELDGFEFEIIGPYAGAKPTGQPLPGMLATLAITGALGGVAYHRKKSQK